MQILQEFFQLKKYVRELLRVCLYAVWMSKSVEFTILQRNTRNIFRWQFIKWNSGEMHTPANNGDAMKKVAPFHIRQTRVGRLPSWAGTSIFNSAGREWKIQIESRSERKVLAGKRMNGKHKKIHIVSITAVGKRIIFTECHAMAIKFFNAKNILWYFIVASN